MTPQHDISVIKRDGRREHLDISKVHRMTFEACDELAGVSASQIEMNSGLQFYDGITTDDVQAILVRSASDLISLENPNYQFAAARLLLFALRKQALNSLNFGEWPFLYPHLKDIIGRNLELGLYDTNISEIYDEDEIDKLNSFINHDRDFLFTYAGLRQVVDKYLVQDRSTGAVFETPQYMYILIAAHLFANYPESTRLQYVKRYYNAISTHRINIPTPVMAGVRTPLRQFASCVLVDVDDSLPSIFSSDMAIGRYVAQRAGIGINAGRIRGINSKIRGGEVQHTGIIPFLKKFEATVRCCTQNGVRGGSATTHFPIWYQEIEDILVLKNNKGTDDNRVRKLDYSVQLRRLFYERYISDSTITLFSPHNAPELYEVFMSGDDVEFQELYEKYERAYSIPKKTVSARELINGLLKERAETGRVYIMNVDHCNTHSSFTDTIYMSNLCQEITLPTQPIQEIDSDGEIALCILSAVNIGRINHVSELEEVCDLAVRALDEIIDMQDYPVPAAEKSTRARRSLGIGYIGLAHYLAKNKVGYNDEDALQLINQLSEAFQYYLLKSSNNLALEKGKCEYFDRTKYAQGILPIDTYKKDVDELVSNELQYDWEQLREDIKHYGLRNSTLSAQMPSESSSVVSNETNGIEPPRDYISTKKSKKGPLKQIVPEFNRLKNFYTLLWDMPNNDGYIKLVSIMQKYFDQAISGNWSYNPLHYENNEVPLSVMANDLLKTYKYGWKTSYYQNTYDFKTDDSVDSMDDDMHISSDQRGSFKKALELTQVDDEECDACTI